MDETDRLRLRDEAADFRRRAATARSEATQTRLQPWRASLLIDSADYYDRRAEDAERRLLADRPIGVQPTAPQILKAQPAQTG